MKLRASLTAILVLLAGSMIFAPWQEQLYAQEARGTILGKVFDAQKAVVPNATVKITNVAQGTSISVKTNDVGAYLAPLLNPGTYEITVEVQGFKKYIKEKLTLNINQKLETDIHLETGAPTETITVTAENVVLNTTTATLGQVVDARRIADLPLAHGNPFLLIGVTAGASWSHTAGSLNRPFEPTHIVGYAINGSRANRMDVTIDGTPSTATATRMK